MSRMKQLYTKWGKGLKTDQVLQEYPRPLKVRESYINLNGYWDYAITKQFKKPKTFQGKILVPFSPESALSQVGVQVMPNEYLWYRRQVTIDQEIVETGARLMLHFGAVDQACIVYVNGQKAGHHTGGYLPFSVDMTEHLDEEGQAELLIAVRDLSDTSYHSRGKQKLKSGGMFYTAQSGIWQTVWMEYVPYNGIRHVRSKPDADRGKVQIQISTRRTIPVEIYVHKPALYPEPMKEPKLMTVPKNGKWIQGKSNKWITIDLKKLAYWTCEEPYLYYFSVKTENDQVDSYFALRTFTQEPDSHGRPRICLNHKPQFQKGVLDQGYWPDGLYTAPADEALIFDIQAMKDMGFNMMRKHIKIEPQRWYYHCDRLGMVVWQDMVNGGRYYKHWFVTYIATLFNWWNIKVKDTRARLMSRTDNKGRREFMREMRRTVEVLDGHPSIAVWVIFNEAWGQFQTEDMTRILRAKDKTRLIDPASGWFDQGGGDIHSIHNYFFKLVVPPESNRVTALSEYGGYSYRVPEHSACEKLYGYGVFKDQESLNEAFQQMEENLMMAVADGLSASVYTQLSDVEEEVNGIFTYDREVQKIHSIYENNKNNHEEYVIANKKS